MSTEIKRKPLSSEEKLEISSKRIRGSNYVKIEEDLDNWFKSVLAYKNITLNGPLIQAQAIKYITMLNQTDFKVSNGWLNGFKKRHNTNSKRFWISN
ncbi:tigger transposable element-derived 4-like [Brachionus plicatilis]|uniref:Tigger transposable element-derived 4-like n=1 Tax=Brachionus plicatilis TaxID=10195 RepID=A0A3M7RX84_BRAPC|nr:tigger transposable element-derived 4-like [Brachionus plicatilis]